MTPKAQRHADDAQQVLDEQDVATAILLGCTFWRHPDRHVWWVNSRTGKGRHPLEEGCGEGWETQGELARAFSAFTLESSQCLPRS